MTEKHKDTGTGWPNGEAPASPVPDQLQPAPPERDTAPSTSDRQAVAGATGERAVAGSNPLFRQVITRLNSPGVTIGLLLALLGFALVVQVKNTSTEAGLSAARLQDLVRIQSDLEAREERLRQEITSLEESQRRLTSGARSREAALAEATRRADELGILAGTLKARGPGLSLEFVAGPKPIRASMILDAVQELRGAGAEAMQISGGDGAAVRIIASTYFLDAANGALNVDGKRLTGPYTILAIGDARTMRTALSIPGGVVESVKGDGGNVIVWEREVVDVLAVSEPADLQHARPVS